MACLRIGGQKLPQIYLYIRKNRWQLGLCPLGELTTLPHTPKSDLRRFAPVVLTPYDCTFNTHPGLRCLKYGHLKQITIVHKITKRPDNMIQQKQKKHKRKNILNGKTASVQKMTD